MSDYPFMSDNPFSGWANQVMNDGQRINNTINSMLAYQPLPDSSNLNASTAQPELQNQTPAASRTDKVEAVAQNSNSLIVGAVVLLGGIALLGSFVAKRQKPTG